MTLLTEPISRVFTFVTCEGVLLDYRYSQVNQAIELMRNAREYEAFERAKEGFNPLSDWVDVVTGAVLLVDRDKKLQAIFTYKDLIKFLNRYYARKSSNGIDITRLLKDIATKNPVCLNESSTVSQLLSHMTSDNGRSFRHLPVVDTDGRPIGMIHLKDAMQLVTKLMRRKAPEWSLEDMGMKTGVDFSVAPKATLVEVVASMIERGRRFAVVGNNFGGFITEWGIIRSVLIENLDFYRTTVDRVANMFIPEIPRRSTLVEAAETMLREDYHQLLVRDDDGGLYGVVSMQDIISEMIEHFPIVFCVDTHWISQPWDKDVVGS